MRNVDKIIRIDELAILVVIFFGLLYFLFPSKDRLESLILSENKNIDLAQSYLEKSLELDPKNVKLLISLAKRDIQSGEFEKAKEIVAKILSYTKPNLQVYDLLYEIYKHEHKEEQMRQIVRAVAKEMPSSLQELQKWYWRAIEAKEKASAFAMVKEIFKHQSTYRWAKEYYALAVAMDRPKDQKRALKVLEASGETRWLQEAFYYSMRTGDYQKAAALAHELYERTKSSEWMRNEALVLERLGRWQGAKRLWEQLLGDERYQKEAFNHILTILLEQKRDVKSFIFAHKKIWQRDPALMKRMIRIFLGNGRLHEAEMLSDLLVKEGL